MIRFLLRFIGLWILAAGFVFFVYDGTRSIAGNALYLTKFNEIWNAVHSSSLQLLQTSIERHAGAWVWDQMFVPVLTAPISLIFGVLGAALILLGRKKKPLIGYARS